MAAVEAGSQVRLDAVRSAFAEAVSKQQGVGGASISVHFDGRELLTLVGGTARPGQPWTADTRSCLMSVTKGFAGLVVAMLAERGQLDPDARVAS